MIRLDRVDKTLDEQVKDVPDNLTWRRGIDIDRRELNAKRTIDY
jgi:hypothetical protein